MNRVLVTFALTALLGTVGVAAQQTQTASAASDRTSTAAPAQSKNESSDDVSLKRVYLYIGLFAGVIGLGLYFWRGMHWAAFTPLESEAGRERLRKIIEGAFRQDPKIFVALVNDILNNPNGHEIIAGYAVAHWQTDEDKKFLALLLRYLASYISSDEGAARTMALVADYSEKWAKTRATEQKSEDVGREVVKRPFHSNSEREAELHATRISRSKGNPEALIMVLDLFKALREPDDDDTEEEKS